MKTFVLVFLFVVIACSSHAQESSNTAPTTSTYDSLVARVKAFDKTVSFYELRMAYINSDGYQPYDTRFNSVLIETGKLMSNNQYAEALSVCEKALDSMFCSINLQFQCLVASNTLDSGSKKTKYYAWVVSSMLKSVDSSGDGMSPETAVPVVSVAEEYFWLHFKKVTLIQQALVYSNHHSMDAMTVRDDTGKEFTYYFIIDGMLQSMSRKINR